MNLRVICVELGPLAVSTSNLVSSQSPRDVLLISWVMILIGVSPVRRVQSSPLRATDLGSLGQH